jgi:hypothetical protein
MRIVNIIPYFNEEYHLLLRIDSILDSIDRLVICEGDRTHSGDPKSFTCEDFLSRRGLLSDKITCVRINLPSREENPNHWSRENHQRDVGIQFAMPDDLVISTDCDEFINMDHLTGLVEMVQSNPGSVVKIPMTIHNCRADMSVCNPDGSRMMTDSAFACLASAVGQTTLSRVRESLSYRRTADVTVLDYGRSAGWHLTWMGLPTDRIGKMRSFAHADDDITNGVGQLSSQDAIDFVGAYLPRVGDADLLNRGDHRMCRYPVDELPQEILSNRELRDFYLPVSKEDLYR